MIRYELRKVLQSPAALLILILLALNCVLDIRLNAPGVDWGYDEKDIQEVYAELKPETAVETLREAQERLTDAENSFAPYDGVLHTEDIYTERELLQGVLIRAEETAGYHAYIEDVLLTAQYQAGLPMYSDKTAFGYRNLARTAQVYSRFLDLQPPLLYSGMAESLPQRHSDLIVVLLTLLLGLELFTKDRCELILATKRGRFPLFCAKFTAGASLLALSTVLLFATNLAIGFFRCGMTPLSAPIQAIFGFQQSPWAITVGAYYALFLLCKLVLALTLLAVITLGCNLWRTPVGSCLAALALSLPSFLLLQCSDLRLQAFSLVRLSDTARIFQTYYNVNLMENPVPDSCLAGFASLLYLLSSFLGAALLWCRSKPIRTQKKRKVKHVRVKIGGLLRMEARKLFLMEKGALILALLVLVQVAAFWDVDERLNLSERLYQTYAERLTGPPNETSDAIIAEKAAYYASLDATGMPDGDAEEWWQIQAREVFERVRDQYERAKNNNVEFVSELPYERLLGRRGRTDFLELTMKLFLCLILGLSSVFAVERETGMEQLLIGTVRRKRANRCKVGLSLGYALIATLVAYVPQIVMIHRIYSFDGLTCSALSVPTLGIPFGSVLFAICLYGFGALLLSMLAALLILFLSQKTGSTLRTLLWSAVCLLLPAAIMLLCMNL